MLYMMLLRAATASAAPDEEFLDAHTSARGVTSDTRDAGKANAYGLALSHRDWLFLDEERQRIRCEWHRFFQRFDLLLCPPLASAAFPHSTVHPQKRTLSVNGKEVRFENQLLWAGYGGVAYLPDTVAPHRANLRWLARRCPDHRTLFGRLYVPALRPVARGAVPRLRATAGVRSRVRPGSVTASRVCRSPSVGCTWPMYRSPSAARVECRHDPATR